MSNDTSSSPDGNGNVRQVKCPTCGKLVAWVPSEIHRPFCSRQCQLIDFGDWASERNTIPAEDPPDTMDEDDGE